MICKKKNNIFKKTTTKKIVLSDHFFKRWNERIGQIQFKNKADLQNYIQKNFKEDNMYHLYEDQYLMDGIIGGVYLTAIEEKERILLITTLGSYDNNPTIYNIITSGKLKYMLKEYGKINLSYAV